MRTRAQVVFQFMLAQQLVEPCHGSVSVKSVLWTSEEPAQHSSHSGGSESLEPGPRGKSGTIRSTTRLGPLGHFQSCEWGNKTTESTPVLTLLDLVNVNLRVLGGAL